MSSSSETPRPQPRRRSERIGFDRIWWALVWLVVVVIAVFPFPWWWL